MWRYCIGALALLAAGGGAAQDVDLYQAEVTVPDRSAEARAAGLAEALARVLVKNTGNPAAPRAPGVQTYLQQAAQYAQQFSYGRRIESLLGEESPQAVLTLSARFEPETVERIIREAGLARWGSERPATLLWIAMETPAGERVLVGQDYQAMAAVMRRAAEQRGIPVLLPLLDLQDQRAVNMRELWGGFAGPMAQASARYGTETFLMGRLEPLGEKHWKARWVLYDQGRQSYGATEGTLSGVLTAGIDFAANTLGARYAIAPGDSLTSGALIAVHGVGGVGDYARVLDYFQQLSVVEDLDLVVAAGDRLDLRLQLSAGLERLDRVIALGRVLSRRVDTGMGGVQPVGTRVYQREYQLLP